MPSYEDEMKIHLRTGGEINCMTECVHLGPHHIVTVSTDDQSLPNHKHDGIMFGIILKVRTIAINGLCGFMGI